MNKDHTHDERRARAVTTSEGDVVVEVELVSRNLGLSPDAFLREMKRGAVRGKVERGEGEDAGRMRLTFRYRGRSWALIIDESARSS